MDYLHFFFAALLIIALIALVIFVYRFAALKAQLPLLVQDKFELWKGQAEYDMQDKIRQRVQEWRDREGQTILAEAQRNALVQAHNLFKEWKQEQEKQIRQDAVQRSQQVTTGKIAEQLVPYLPNFNYNPKDARFIGSPIDFVIFDGLNDEAVEQIRNVIFIEIKTGASALTKRERLVRDAIKAGRVKWVEWHASRELQQAAPSVFE
jgi:predicted Holliday junction resolvase-like endonuclease